MDLRPEELSDKIIGELAEYFGNNVHFGGLKPTGMGADHRGTSKLPASRGSDMKTLEAAEHARDEENALALADTLKHRRKKRASRSSSSSGDKQAKKTSTGVVWGAGPESNEDSDGKSDEEMEMEEEAGSSMVITTPMPVPASTIQRPSSLRKKILDIKAARSSSEVAPPASSSSSSSSSSVVPQPGVEVPAPLPNGPRGATPPLDNAKRVMRQENAEKMLEPYVLLCDGDFGHTNFIMNSSTPSNEICAKTHGGASMTQQPADTGRGHAIMRQMMHSSDFRYEDNHSDPSGNGWEELKRVLREHLTPALFRNVWKALCHLSVKAGKAFAPSTVQSGFNTSGLITYEGMRQWAETSGETHFSDYNAILSVNPHYRKLSPAQAQLVTDSIPMFGNIMMEKGLIYEEDLDDFFKGKEGIDNHVQPPVHFQSLNNKSVHNQRAAIISNGPFRERVSMLAQDKQNQQVNKKWRIERRQLELKRAVVEANREKALRTNQEREARLEAGRKTTEANRFDSLTRPYTNTATSTRAGRGAAPVSSSSVSSGEVTAPVAPAQAGPKKHIKQCFVCHDPLENPVKCGAKSCRTVACDREDCQIAFARHREFAHTT